LVVASRRRFLAIAAASGIGLIFVIIVSLVFLVITRFLSAKTAQNILT
jgi:hypothetical protein